MKVIMGGIIKHIKGYGFKLTFPSPETANHYKDMIRYILTSDNIPLIYNTRTFDEYDTDGDRTL